MIAEAKKVLRNIILIRNKPNLHLLSTHIYIWDYKTSFVYKTSSVGFGGFSPDVGVGVGVVVGAAGMSVTC